MPELKHTLQQLPGAFLSCLQSLLLRGGCPAWVQHDRWHVAEKCKILTAQLPYAFICELSKEDIVQPCACILPLQWSWRKQMLCLTQHCQYSCHSLLGHCCSYLRAPSRNFVDSSRTCRYGHAVLSPSVKSFIRQRHKVLYKQQSLLSLLHSL